jgi:tetratricopeptide (TPR) repeat protein
MILDRRIMSTNGESKKLSVLKNRSRAIVIIISGVVLVLLFCFVALPSNKYSQASNALANMEYDKAISVFKSLGGYQNSFDLLKESQYQKANDLITHRQYMEAVNILSTLEAYKNSSELLSKAENLNEKETKYQLAYKLLVQGKYELAIKYFTEIGDYKDSTNLLYKANEIYTRLKNPLP